MPKKLRMGKRWSRFCEYLFILPAVIFLLVFIVYPIIYNFVLSVNDIDLGFFATREYNFVGLRNYSDLFHSEDRELLNALKNTLMFTIVCITLQMLISFSLALLLSRDSRLNRFSRSAIVIANIIPQTITAMMFKFMFSTENGIINYILISLGIIEKPVRWLLSGNTAMISLVIANLWMNVPFSMLLFLSGLTTVDPTYAEAAMLDGAGWWRRLISITIPSISETIKVVLTLGFINTFKVFDIVYIITNGGPGKSTEMLSTLSYKLSFVLNYYDSGAVASNILFLILLIVGLIYIRVVNREDDNI